MSYQFLQRFEAHLTKTAIELIRIAIAARYYVPMNRTQMLKQVSFLLEHGNA